MIASSTLFALSIMNFGPEAVLFIRTSIIRQILADPIVLIGSSAIVFKHDKPFRMVLLRSDKVASIAASSARGNNPMVTVATELLGKLAPLEMHSFRMLQTVSFLVLHVLSAVETSSSAFNSNGNDLTSSDIIVDGSLDNSEDN